MTSRRKFGARLPSRLCSVRQNNEQAQREFGYLLVRWREDLSTHLGPAVLLQPTPMCALEVNQHGEARALQFALGELLFSQANSRFYEPLSITPKGELLLSRTGEPLPIGDRLALHSRLARATRRAAAK